MNHDTITRVIIESTVTRALDAIQSDPKRNIRKLVDMGDQFAEDPFQRTIFDMAQKMMENEDSAYYTLMQNAAESVNHQALTRFGMNVGLNSWICGANHIREEQEAGGYHIPWGILLHVQKGTDPLCRELARLLVEGKQAGIYTYFVEVQSAFSQLPQILQAMQQERECAFVLMVQAETLTVSVLNQLQDCPNVMTLLDTQSENWQLTAKALRDLRILWGVFCRYDNTTATNIVSGEWMEDVLPHAGIFAFCVADDSISPQQRAAVEQYVIRSRMEQRYAALLVDFYTDFLRIDEVISQDAELIGIRPDGRVTACRRGVEQDTALSIMQEPLERILYQQSQKTDG